MTNPGMSMDEIRDLVRNLPPPDLDAGTAVRTLLSQTPAAPSLGAMTEVVAFIAGWQGKVPPEGRHPRVAVFAAAHGIAATPGLSDPTGPSDQEKLAAFQAGRGLTSAACRTVDSDLRIYELGLDQPVGDITRGRAQSEAEAAHAMAYGMMAVDQGLHLLALGTLGAGGRLSAAAVCTALIGGEPADWLRVGDKMPSDRLEIEAAAVTAAVGANARAAEDPLTALALLGGREMCAVAGAILAARLAKTPVLLDGFVTLTAAAMLWAVDPKSIDHCLVAHRTNEAGQHKLLDRIGRTALLDFGLPGGEGMGAALALGPLKAALDAVDLG